MNKFRIIITDPNGKELFNRVYEVPVQCKVINYITEDPGFLKDLQESGISINEPNLIWDIYSESPLESEIDMLNELIPYEL